MQGGLIADGVGNDRLVSFHEVISARLSDVLNAQSRLFYAFDLATWQVKTAF